MEMEVVLRVPPAGDFFNFGSPSSSHFLTAPSTPRRPFSASSLSAPTSPSHASDFYRDLNVDLAFVHRHDDDVPIGSPSAVPFLWEEKPGIPKALKSSDEDFEFDFSGQLLNKTSLSADELFDGGKIKPLKPPPGFQSTMSSPRSPHNSKLSPRKSKNDIDDDPFEAALIKETRSRSSNELGPQKRGRDKISYISSNFARKGTRSVSPFRMSGTVLDEDDNDGDDDDNSLAAAAVKAKSSSFLSAISFSKGNRKWRLRDLLFRSASEGRATEKDDQMRTYVVMPKKVDDDVKSSSFRSADSGGSGRRGPGSALEMHYTAANLAVSEELVKKKSFSPYKPGLLGRCLRFNRPGMHEISRGIGSLTRG